MFSRLAALRAELRLTAALPSPATPGGTPSRPARQSAGSEVLTEARRCRREHNLRIQTARGRRVRALLQPARRIVVGSPRSSVRYVARAIQDSCCATASAAAGHESPGEGGRGWLRGRRATKGLAPGRSQALWPSLKGSQQFHGPGLASRGVFRVNDFLLLLLPRFALQRFPSRLRSAALRRRFGRRFLSQRPPCVG